MPDCEILCVGTELLLGQILNTNAQFLSQELAKLGINCYFQTTVGDNPTRIVAAIRQAIQRAHIVLITGGLGPTADDLTTECVAQSFETPLIFDEAVCDRIQQFFKVRGYPMPESNRKQAMRPDGSQILPNPQGTAPGIIWELEPATLEKVGNASDGDRRIIMTFPGVPSELHTMWKETAAPYLQSQYGQQVLHSVDLKHYGIGESMLAEKYAKLLDMANPTVAPYAGRGECKLRVTARASTIDDAVSLAESVAQQIEAGSGELCYGRDDDTLESVLGALLSSRNLTIAFAESCTGGLATTRLTDIAGSSHYIDLSLITYSNGMKLKMLGVDDLLLRTSGAVSPECAEAMALGIRNIGESSVGVSITGIAGPTGGTDEKPIGLVYMGVSTERGVVSRRLSLPSHLGRSEIRHRSASEALNMVRLMLLRNEI